LEWILRRLETNLAMQVNAKGDIENYIGIIIGYITDENLGKMPHGLEYYQNSIKIAL
jgi:hypothetical protein